MGSLIATTGRGKFWWTLALCSLAWLPSCTSVRWRDARGWDHQVGLFAYRIDQFEHGKSIERMSLGIDCRLSGHDRGLSLGWRRVTERVPRVIDVETPEELPDRVARQMRGEPFLTAEPTSLFHPGGTTSTGQAVALPEGYRSRQPRHESRYGFLYLATPPEDDPVIVETGLVGVQWRQGDAPKGFFAGHASSFHLVGRALQDGIALIRTWPNGPDRDEFLVLYTLRDGNQDGHGLSNEERGEP